MKADIVLENIWLKVNIVYKVILVIISSFLIFLSAQISINLPFTPVPITGQTFTILLISLILPKEWAFYSIIAYIIEGALGFPVFANFKGGINVILGPTGGYILSWIFVVFILKFLLRYVPRFFALLLTSLYILIIGSLWLSIFVGIENAFKMGFLPFIIGDFIKIIILSIIPISKR
ncbi:MAG: biotin transporter BioY [candidate division WOR-3 bacterium]|nr:biotin transporter BioY [candidate division WOR-3 bacterium]MCX7947971.1 biotin transporter BioY [candidate division WOR-3 bacterium]MDW8150915.1 biotin transporter BioY [candidate division WOR-3 bacterium]